MHTSERLLISEAQELAVDNVKVRGHVTRLYPNDSGCYIRIKDPRPALVPLYDYFWLDCGHQNYVALYTLALSALLYKKELTIRTREPIDPNQLAVVLYMILEEN